MAAPPFGGQIFTQKHLSFCRESGSCCMILVENITLHHKNRKIIFVLDDVCLAIRNTSWFWYDQSVFCPGVDGLLSL